MKRTAFSFQRSIVIKLLFLVLAPFFLSACSGLVTTEQAAVSDWETLSAGQTCGQTFVAKFDGLAGIYFYLSPQETGAGEIRLHLRSGPQEKDDLAVSSNTVAIDAIRAPGYYVFFLPPQDHSNQKYYYAFLEVVGNGEAQIGKASGNSYLNGAFYKTGEPEDAQATFKLIYSRRHVIPGLGGEAVTWIGILVLGFFLFILPGWGVFSLLWPGWGILSWPEKMGLSAGLSLALYPLLLLWTDIVGLHLGPIYAWIPPIVGAIIILSRNRKRLTFRNRSLVNTFRLPWADVAFLGIVGLIVLTRFWVIRSLDLPMWGDSYQHTMISQLIVDQGGLFTSWKPYAELTTLTYHFGFHSDVAVFDWISHLEMAKAALWVGQLVNVLAVISLYPLAVKVGRSKWAGVGAVLVAGLLSPMPMYYINWGRYTQLAGQVILPVVAWILWQVLALNNPPEQKRQPIGSLIIGCLCFGGLALTHYRVLILAVIFLMIVWFFYARRKTWFPMLQRTLWMGLGGGLLFLPWFIRVFAGRIFTIFSWQISTSATQAVETDPQLANFGNLSLFLPIILWLIMVVFIGIGLWRREKGVLLVIIWWGVSFVAANPWMVGLPGSGAVTAFAVLIGIYIPAGLLAGAAAAWLEGSIFFRPGFHPKLRPIFSIAAAMFLGVMSIAGVSRRLIEAKPAQFALASRPDVLASAWLEKNTPAEARILVNSFPAFSNYVIVGSDGGWWLPLLARRLTTVPPINYGFEKDPWPDFRVEVNRLTFEIEQKGVQDPAVISLMKNRGISYIYIGQFEGRVNSPGPLFTADQLLASPDFRLVYHQDRVWIFQLKG